MDPEMVVISFLWHFTMGGEAGRGGGGGVGGAVIGRG